MNKRIRFSAFWQAVAIVAAAYLLFNIAFPPLIPRALLLQYMSIVVVAVLLYFSFDEARWSEFKAPPRALVHERGLWPARMLLLAGLPLLIGYAVYAALAPALEAPVELRQVHPAPPTTLQAFGKTYDLGTLENPVRKRVLDALPDSPDAAWSDYRGAVASGREVYYRNCFYCHGDLLDGQGMFAGSLNPRPANFRDVGTLAQLQEGYLFWRIATGGPGLPKEGAPWNSAMPVWHEMLSEEEVWNVITFLYDHVGQVPRTWDPKVANGVSRMQEQIKSERRGVDEGIALYQFHCAACHGETGAGDGPAADFVYPRPRDFTTGVFKDKNSPAAALPTDEDLFNTIDNGLPGTAMPAWGSLLGDPQIRSLVRVVKGFDLVGSWAPEDASDSDFDAEGHYLGEPISVHDSVGGDGQVRFGPESVAAGRKAFLETCAQCHGEDGRGNPGVDKRLKDDWGARIWPRDLTKPWTWRVTNAEGSRDRTVANLFTRLTVGIPGTPMPAHADTVSEEERWNIANYVYTLRDYTPPPGGDQVIRGKRVDGPLPMDVGAAAWAQAEPVTLMLLPNIIKEGRLFKPLSDAVTVRVLYNAEAIAFLLEIDDRTYSRPGDADAEKTQDRSLPLHSDAFAIQLPKQGAYSGAGVVDKPLFRHGDRDHPTTIWYWNAGSVEPAAAPGSLLLDASGVDQKLQPRPRDTSLKANGQWLHGRWRVTMHRPLRSLDGGDLELSEGRFVPVSFANWDGSNGEIGSRHTLSSWYWLLLPPAEDPLKTWAAAAAGALLAFAVLFAGLRRARGRKRG